MISFAKLCVQSLKISFSAELLSSISHLLFISLKTFIGTKYLWVYKSAPAVCVFCWLWPTVSLHVLLIFLLSLRSLKLHLWKFLKLDFTVCCYSIEYLSLLCVVLEILPHSSLFKVNVYIRGIWSRISCTTEFGIRKSQGEIFLSHLESRAWRHDAHCHPLQEILFFSQTRKRSQMCVWVGQKFKFVCNIYGKTQVNLWLTQYRLVFCLTSHLLKALSFSLLFSVHVIFKKQTLGNWFGWYSQSSAGFSAILPLWILPFLFITVFQEFCSFLH